MYISEGALDEIMMGLLFNLAVRARREVFVPRAGGTGAENRGMGYSTTAEPISVSGELSWLPCVGVWCTR